MNYLFELTLENKDENAVFITPDDLIEEFENLNNQKISFIKSTGHINRKKMPIYLCQLEAHGKHKYFVVNI